MIVKPYVQAAPVPPWAAALALPCSAFAVSALLLVSGVPQRISAGAARKTAIGAVLNVSRTGLGLHFYEVADLYFHRGTDRVRHAALRGTLFQRLGERVMPRVHVHREGGEIREIMPWLWMSVNADPQRVETYLVAAFWLVHGCDRPDLALDVLRAAAVNVPRHYEVYLEMGRVHLGMNDEQAAARAIDAALAVWPSGQDPDGEQALYGRVNLLMLRASLYEMEGHADKAVRLWRSVLDLRPDRQGIRERLAALTGGQSPRVSARQLGRALLEEHRDAGHACDHDCEHAEHGRHH